MADTPAPVIMELRRRETFSCAHRLHSRALSDEENARIYGKCNNPKGHGHNYVIFVTVRGAVDASTGMVMNISELKDCMARHVVDVLDHKHIDEDVPFFRDSGIPSTTENLCLFAWNALDKVFVGRQCAR